MPNQYTKFQAASKDPTSRAFTFREWNGKKKKRGKTDKGNEDRDGKSVPHRKTSNSSSDSDGTLSVTSDTDRSISPSSSLLQYCPSGGLRIDPFSAYPVIPDHSELAVLDHYFYVLAPSGKQNDLVLRPHTQHIDPHVNMLFPYVMHHAYLFDAMIASCQASMSLSSGLSAYNDLFFIKHRGRAISGLRQRLQQRPDTSTLICVALLVTCDYLLGDLKAVALHTKTLQNLVDILGELPEESPWDRFVKHGVQAYKYVGFMATGVPSEDVADDPLSLQVDPFKDLEYPEQPFNAVFDQKVALLPEGFVGLIKASLISTQLCAIVTAFAELVTGTMDCAIDSLRILNPVQAALQRFAQHTQASYLERCLAAGLLAYTFQFPRVTIPNMFHDPPLQGMVRLFTVSHRPRSDDERALLMWTTIVAQSFMAARASPMPKSREVFASFVKREPSMRNWSAVEEAVRCFFWTPSLLDRWQKSHESLLAASDRLVHKTDLEAITDNHQYLSNEAVGRSIPMCPVTGKVGTTVDDPSGLCPFSTKTTT